MSRHSARLAVVLRPTMSRRGRMTSRTSRCGRSKALSRMSRPADAPPARFWTAESNSRISSSEWSLLHGIELADAQLVEQPLGGTVQHPDARVGEPVKPVQRQGGPQRRRNRPPDGDGLGNQFTDDDQEVTADQETDEEIEGGFESGRAEAQQAEQRVQQRLESGLHDDAGADPAERHAHLGGADAGFEVADQALGQGGATVALRRQRGHLRLPQLHERKLGGHEKAVQQHEHHHREELEQDRNDGVGIHVTG
jgi:hypothetical protein